MKLTTKDIIKQLPLGESLQNELLNNYDSFDSNKQFIIDRVIWNTYDAIYQSFIDKNVELLFHKTDTGETNLDKNFYAQAVKQADQEFKDYMEKHATDDALKGVRDKLESLIKPS